MNMFKPTNATSVTSYLAALPPERAAPVRFLHDVIRQSAPGLKPHFAANMLGYGKFSYVNYKKERVQWPIVALASQKNYISIYVCALDNGEYLAEKYKNELGKVSVGKSCIRFKKLEDVHLPTLNKVIKLAAKSPGLVGAGEHQKKTKAKK